MFGRMQDRQLMISDILVHASRHHGSAEVVSRTDSGALHRTSYAEAERRSRCVARALKGIGVGASDRVGTLAWNGFRHIELYYGISGSEAICHTINPRLAPDEIASIINHAGDRVLFADKSLSALVALIGPHIAQTVRIVVFMVDQADMPDVVLPAEMQVLCYEALIANAGEEFAWPVFNEHVAASLCYTSGTTGRPKGVLYSHRSTVLHALSLISPDVCCLRAIDRVMPVVPMFHVHAWGLPYAAPMVGAALVLPGRYLDCASLIELMNAEGVTMAAGVPTIWASVLQRLRESGTRLRTVERLQGGGAACPRHLIEAFEREFDVPLYHGWGMTETSPVGVICRPKPANCALTGEDRLHMREKQGRAAFGMDIDIVDENGVVLPWDGRTRGRLRVRGPWVSSAYFEDEDRNGSDSGWLDTGDIATIDSEGYVEIVDRSKDLIKSGGEWIGSVQLENIAGSHPAVAEAAVIAVKHPQWGERPLLLLVLKAQADVRKADLLQLYEGRVPKWWAPDDVVIVDALPHTATGKLNKAVLRTQYGDHLITGATSRP